MCHVDKPASQHAVFVREVLAQPSEIMSRAGILLHGIVRPENDGK
jgi:hypothetical protein